MANHHEECLPSRAAVQDSTAEQPVTFWELFMTMCIPFEERMDDVFLSHDHVESKYKIRQCVTYTIAGWVNFYCQLVFNGLEHYSRLTVASVLYYLV